MMTNRRLMIVLTASALAMTAGAAHAQSAGGQPVGASQESAANVAKADSIDPSGEVIVTARRRDESLQNVPQTVTAISANTVQRLNILRAEDIVSTVPGLNLTNDGSQQTASIRGVSLDSYSGAAPTVDLYINDTPTPASTFFTALYDLGQIELLRGPQGTLRGRTAPSGAITLSTHRADLDKIGGYVGMTGTSRGGINAQGALGLPIVADRLAVRVAGVVDRDRANFVRSVLGGPSPDRVVWSGRATVAARPVDAVRLSAVYEHVDEDRFSYTSVEGNGSPGGAGFPRAGYNGPPLKASDRASVQTQLSEFVHKIDFVSGSIDIDLPGHTLSYVGGYQRSYTLANGNLDRGNIFTNTDVYQRTDTRQRQTTQEVRLASNRSGSFLDYVVGFYYSRSSADVTLTTPGSFLAGAFGSPAVVPVVPGTLNRRYELDVAVTVNQSYTEKSVFGSLIAHIGPRTELTVGGRYINQSSTNYVATSLGGAFVAVAVPAPCSFLGATSTYPGYCDFAVAPSNGPISTFGKDGGGKAGVYSATLSHRFTDDLNIYANFGTSYRPGPQTIGISNASNDPVLNDLTYLRPEKSRSYEIGVKTALFNRRLRVNAAVFHQDFDGFIERLPETPYLSNNGAQQDVSAFPFTVNADAKVTGFDVDASFSLLRGLNVSGAVSYAKGNLNNALVPCRDSNFDGTPDLGTVTVAQFKAAGKTVAFCRSNISTSRDARWSANAQAEYARPVAGVDAYVRGLVNYRPSNPNQDIGFTINSYALVNLYAGIRSPTGRWDLGVFAKNALANGTQLSRIYQPNDSIGGSINYFGPTGYSETSYTRPREVGLTLRYSFGGR